MARNLGEREVIATTLGAIRESRARLIEQRDKLTEQIREQDEVEHFWQRRLAQLGEDDAGQGKPRARKGEPKRRVLEYFATLEGKGASMTVVADMTGLGWSTVRAVLKRHPEIFTEWDNEWYLKADRANGKRLLERVSLSPPPDDSTGDKLL